jgi:hypothetical protein
MFADNVPITTTNQTNYFLVNLKPNTDYHVKLQYVTEQGESVLSDSTVFHTDDECK